jgi:hypothetical protein
VTLSAVRAPWSSASFLVYLGGLVILGATLSLLLVQSDSHRPAGFVFWAALIFAVLASGAFLLRRSGHLLAAGVLALSSVASLVVFWGAVLDWIGWLPDNPEPSFKGFHFSLLFLELVTLVAAVAALRRFRFPLLVLVVAASAWYFTTDLISNGGDWSAIVTIAVGLAFLIAGMVVDAASSRIFGFWLHVAAGLTIGGGLVWFFHDGDFDWILIAAVGFAYIALGDRLLRSSWVVIGAWGVLQTASHYADKWSHIGEFFPLVYFFPFVFSFDESYGEQKHHTWAAPLSFAIAGAVFIGIALLIAKRRRGLIPAAELI